MGLHKRSSTAVSSYCANGNQTYGTPLPIDYANINYPVPADVYRYMSGTKTLRTLYTTAETVFAFSTYPIENLCSTIWNDYAPALMVPRELLSLHPVTELGGGGFCTFSVNEANVFFDPPKALTQMTAAAGPSSPPPTTTTVQMPSISTGEAVPESSAASPTSTDGAASIPAAISSTVTTETSKNTDTLTSALASPDGNPVSSATVPPDQTTNGIAGAIASVLAIPPLLSVSFTPTPGGPAVSSDPTATHQVSTQRPVPVSVDPAAAIISLLPTLIHPLPGTGSPATEDRPAADPSGATAPSPALVWTATDESEYTFPTVAWESSPTSSVALPYSSPVAGVVLTDEATTGEETSILNPTAALSMGSATVPYSYTTSLIGTGTLVAGFADIPVSGTTVPSTAIQTQQSSSLSDATFPIEGVTSAANRPSTSKLPPASLPSFTDGGPGH
ncbi:hypothetical protein B0A55_10927 [Friedmanniomyces simplex]|uniref:Uncharacterized protein n=1 Tax=Friedmanniomyces simplex TaxID=329884 RepID=A0A4U0WPC7_9PEZI|nr:hypothetical protein B0A55_10927 [Friedmanniomyces simplex]